MKDKDIVIVAPYASPAYAWAQARYAEAVAGDVAATLGLDGYYSQLLPGDKVEKVEE